MWLNCDRESYNAVCCKNWQPIPEEVEPIITISTDGKPESIKFVADAYMQYLNGRLAALEHDKATVNEVTGLLERMNKL